MVERFAVGYRIKLYDYKRGNGLLVSSGAGTMQAVMDCTSLRYALDIDENKDERALTSFLVCAQRCTRIVVAGWFSITDPEPLQRALSVLDTQSIVSYTPFVKMPVGIVCHDMRSFLETINNHATHTV